MISSAGADALVALEDAAPDVLFETTPGSDLAIWPQLRWPLAQTLAEVEFSLDPPRPTVPTRLSWRGAISKRVHNIIPTPFSPRHIHGEDLLFIVNGGTFVQTDIGRRNWFTDGLASAVSPRSVVLQDSTVWLWRPANERPVFRPTYAFDRALYHARKSTRPLSSQAESVVRSAVRSIYQELPFDVDDARIEQVVGTVLDRCALAPHIDERFARLIDRVKPKAVFMQTAAYGDRASLIAVLKDRDVLVCEPQHGWIGPSHQAYNFGAAMRRPLLARYMPDVLLTFGEFWSDAVRFPGDTVAIGKPHLEQLLPESRPRNERDRTVLVISSMYERDTVVRRTIEIRSRLPRDWQVLFRPHPAERATVADRYPELVEVDGVGFDRSTDVDEALGRVRAVFGFSSTVLYEALAFQCDAFVFDSDLADLYMDREIFGERITNDDTLQRAVDRVLAADGEEPLVRGSELDRIWKRHALDNFRGFVRDRVDAERA